MNTIEGPWVFDAHKAVQADLMQGMCPGWVIIWGPYWRRYTAWHAADPTQVRRVESADPGELVELIVAAEVEALAGLPAHRSPYGIAPRRQRGAAARRTGHP